MMNKKEYFPRRYRSLQFNICLLLFAALFLLRGNLHAAEPTSSQETGESRRGNGRIAVFLDEERWMDGDFIREQIPVVNYVRDKELADVHIIITRHGAGTAGTNYAISLIGTRAFAGKDYELTYWDPSTNTSDATRRGYTNMLKVGLVPYIANSSMADRIIIEYDYDQQAMVLEERDEPEQDPWNNWVLEVYGGGNFSSEQSRSNWSTRFGLRADRVTTDIKLRFRPYFNFNERKFKTANGTIVSSSHRHGLDSYVIKSINNHWSAGMFASSLSSTFNNMKFNVEFMPALEYSYYPYQEATRRSITLAYRIGMGYYNYLNITVFAKDQEYLFGHALEASARFQQPWGTLRAGVTGSHYFHDFSINRAQVFANIDIRLFQGFSLNMRMDYEMINDLVSISAGNLTLEEILLAQTQQTTNYSVSGSIGLTYTFGSSFRAAYNPRL